MWFYRRISQLIPQWDRYTWKIGRCQTERQKEPESLMSQSCHISPRLPTSGLWFLLLEKNKTPLLFESLFWGLYYYSQFLTPRPITVYSLRSNQRPFKSVKPDHITSIPSHLNLGSLPGQLGFLWSGFSISPVYPLPNPHIHPPLAHSAPAILYLEWAKLVSISGPLHLLFLLPGMFSLYLQADSLKFSIFSKFWKGIPWQSICIFWNFI